MKQLFVFIRKEFIHILRDPLTLAILLGLPLLMLTLFGFAITTEVRNTRVVIYDPSRDDATRDITERLRISDYFILTRYLESPDEIPGVFARAEAGLAVVFSERFAENLYHTGEAGVQLIADGTDPNTATTLVAYATSIIGSFRNELIGAAPAGGGITPEIRFLYNPQLKGAYNFVPGVMGMILMLICAMMTSVAIAREKEKGTMEVLLVSPMKPITIIISKVVPYFMISLVNLTSILLMSVFVLGVPVAGSLGCLVTVSIVFIFVCLALGMLISSMVNTQLVALLISGMALIAPIIILSGMIFPVENMPWFLQWLSNIIPARWYIIAVKKVMIKGLGYASISRELLILGSMAAALLVMSLKKFRHRLE